MHIYADPLFYPGSIAAQGPVGAAGGGAAPPDLDGVERQLYEALGPTPVHLDALCAATALDVSTALAHLLSLEVTGLVRQMAGKQFSRVS